MPEVNAVHLLDCVSQSISTDGTTALIVFSVAGESKDDPPRKFGITLPVMQTRWLLGVVHSMMIMVEKANKQAGANLFNFPLDFSVGFSDALSNGSFPLADGNVMPVGGKVVVSFDFGKPTEMNFVMMNLAGWELANSLHRDISVRLTPQEKTQLKIIKPAGQKIIRPLA